MAQEDPVAYDSEGRLLVLSVAWRERPPGFLRRTFGLWPIRVERVRVMAAEDEPGHATRLRVILEDLLGRDAGLELNDLVQRGVEHLGYTR